MTSFLRRFLWSMFTLSTKNIRSIPENKSVGGDTPDPYSFFYVNFILIMIYIYMELRNKT